MKGYAIGIPTIEMDFGVGGKTDALLQAAKSNKNFVGAGSDGGFSTLIFKTKETALAAYTIARRLGFEIVAIGEVKYEVRNSD